MAKSETTEFKGKTYRRYPESKRRSDRVYFKCRDEYLHIAVWKAEHGDVPQGHHVHHKDGNPLNNDLGNLEAKPAREHQRWHHLGVSTPAKTENLARIRPLASAWHRSSDGKAWHSEHGRECIRARPILDKQCSHCGSAYQTIHAGAKFCSNACKSSARRAAGVDNIAIICPICETRFMASKFSGAKFCSISCSNRNSWANDRRI